MKRDRVLLVFKSGFWFFPGGKQEEGESLEETLSREVFEELGMNLVECSRIVHEGVFRAPRGETYHFHTFSCRSEALIGDPRLNPKDTVTEWAWVDQPLELNLTEHARFILERQSELRWAA